MTWFLLHGLWNATYSMSVPFPGMYIHTARNFNHCCYCIYNKKKKKKDPNLNDLYHKTIHNMTTNMILNMNKVSDNKCKIKYQQVHQL